MYIPLLNITLSVPGIAAALAGGLVLAVADRWYWTLAAVLLMVAGVTAAFNGTGG